MWRRRGTKDVKGQAILPIQNPCVIVGIIHYTVFQQLGNGIPRIQAPKTVTKHADGNHGQLFVIFIIRRVSRCFAALLHFLVDKFSNFGHQSVSSRHHTIVGTAMVGLAWWVLRPPAPDRPIDDLIPRAEADGPVYMLYGSAEFEQIYESLGAFLGDLE